MKSQEIQLPYGLLKGSKSPAISKILDSLVSWKRYEDEEEVTVSMSDLDEDGLEAIFEAAKSAKNQRARNTAGALLAMRRGDSEKKVPNYKAFPAILGEYFRVNGIRGWVFADSGGHLMPYFVHDCTIYEPRSRNDRDAHVSVVCHYVCLDGRSVVKSRRSFNISPSEIAHSTVPDILLGQNIIMETGELLEQYDSQIQRFKDVVMGTFSKQLTFRPSKPARGSRSSFRDEPISGTRKVINDTEDSVFDRVGLLSLAGKSAFAAKSDAQTPFHPVIRVFDLKQHDFYTAHSEELEPYCFDKSLREKLVLPQSHRDLLDVLVSDLSVFSNDIVRGKSAGNVIVCQGKPGLGKTLTCEVYSEITETPIYSVHSGTLGTSPDSVGKSLKMILERQDRWGCIVLLDEADVFISKRGEDLNKNSIVAEFLRMLEYCDGLIFMTTNREGDIDEAIISRAAAIINYEPPSEAHKRELWKVMFAQNEITPPRGLVTKLTALFPEISGRDIKMLLRLALRVHTAMGEDLDADLFRKCAMFRNIKIAEGG